MEELFYSPKEKIAFYIPQKGSGYTNPSNISELIHMLEVERMTFAHMLGNGLRIDKMKTEMIEKSNHYQGMRVFWMEFNKCPEKAFEIGKDWSMQKFISN